MPLKTADNNFGTAKWIVSSAYSDGCTHITIASALTSASSGDTIFIRTGTYTENLTLKAGVNLVAYTVDGITPTVTIIGKLSFSSAGTVSISGIRLQTNSDNFLAVTGSAASIVNLYECYLNATNANGITYSSSSGSSGINLIRCSGNITTTGITAFVHTGAGVLDFRYTLWGNDGNSVTRSTVSSGVVYLTFSQIGFGVTSSSTGLFSTGFSQMSAPNIPVLIHGGRTDSQLYFSKFYSAASTCITVNATLTVVQCDVNSSSSPVINGSASLYTSNLSFSDNATITCTVVGKDSLSGPLNMNNQVKITSGAGSPNGIITAPKGSLYMRTDGSSTSTRAYINTNGSTTWTAITTAA